MVDFIINSIRYYPTYCWISNFYKEKGDFLDFGCGESEFVSYLRKKRCRSYGIDPNVKTASFFSLADIREKHKDAFDVVTINFSLEHCDNPESTLKETRQSLTSDGLIFIKVPNAARKDRFSSFQIKTGIHRSYFSHERLKNLLEKCGFSILKIDTRFCLTSAITTPCSLFAGLDPENWLHKKNTAMKLRKAVILSVLSLILLPYELLKSLTGQGIIIHAVARKISR
jgi:SAM-dependent methyltransferase